MNLPLVLRNCFMALLCVLASSVWAHVPQLVLGLDSTACPGGCAPLAAIQKPHASLDVYRDRLVWAQSVAGADAKIVVKPECIEWWSASEAAPRFVLRVDEQQQDRESAYRKLWVDALARVFYAQSLWYRVQYDPAFPLEVKAKSQGGESRLSTGDAIASADRGEVALVIRNKSDKPVKVLPMLMDRAYEIIDLQSVELAPGQITEVSWVAEREPRYGSVILRASGQLAPPKFTGFGIKYQAP